MYSFQRSFIARMGNQAGGGASHRAGRIYIIQEGENKLFKVGVSGEEDLEKRIDQLQTGNPRKLTECYSEWVSDMKSAEKDAHAFLKKMKADMGGGTEWFEGDLEDIKRKVEKARRRYP